MKLQKFSVLLAMVTFSSIPFVFSVSSAQAAEFTFSGSFDSGYSAKGSFTTKTGTPASFAQDSLQSLSLSVFNANNTLLNSGSNVVNGISNNQFLTLNYDNSKTPNLLKLDISTREDGKTEYYYITNAFNPSNQFVDFGNTNYNLFSFNTGTNTTTYLGSATSIQATQVPESSSVIGLLGFAALGVGSAVRNLQLKKISQSVGV